MKLRIIATEQEFQKILPVLEAHKTQFDSWRKPQKGGNPKYAESNNLLQYLEMDTDTFLSLLAPHEAEIKSSRVKALPKSTVRKKIKK